MNSDQLWLSACEVRSHAERRAEYAAYLRGELDPVVAIAVRRELARETLRLSAAAQLIELDQAARAAGIDLASGEFVTRG